MSRLHIMSPAVFAVLAFAGSAVAQDLGPIREADNHLVLSGAGHQFNLPMPDWIDPSWRQSQGLSALLDVTYTDQDRELAVGLYPKGEGEGFWTKRYGARIVANETIALADYRDAAIATFAATCKADRTGFFQLEPDSDDRLPPLGFVCGEFVDALPGYKGKGEVMVMGFHKSASGLAVVYQEWQGKAFDPSTPGTWPVDVRTVEDRVMAFKSDASLALVD